MHQLKHLLFLLPFLLTGFVHAQQGKIIEKDKKFGIYDERYGQVVEPIYDYIYTINDWSDKLFFVRKDGKHGFVYFRELDSLGNLPYSSPHWVKSSLDYDFLDTKTNSGIGPLPLIVYRRNNKYGLIFLDARMGGGGGVFNITRLSEFGKYVEKKAEYDTLGYINSFSNQFKFIQVKKDEYYDFLRINYNDYLFSEGELMNIKSEIFPMPKAVKMDQDNYLVYYKIVQQGKMGAITFKENGDYEYMMDCKCDEIYMKRTILAPNYFAFFKSCRDTLNQKVEIFYDDSTKTVIYPNSKPIEMIGGYYAVDTNTTDQIPSLTKLITIRSKCSNTDSFYRAILDLNSDFRRDFIENADESVEYFSNSKGFLIAVNSFDDKTLKVVELFSGDTILELPKLDNTKYRMTGKNDYGMALDFVPIYAFSRNKKNEIKQKDLYYYDFNQRKMLKGPLPREVRKLYENE